MKKKYSISFFVAAIVCAVILSFAYRLSYDNERELAQEKKKTEDISVPTEGNASKENTYYLKDLNGFVAVYLSDKKTIFEYTNIRMDELPEDVAIEIQN